MAELVIALLGKFEMRVASSEITTILGQKDRALLAFLSMNAGSSHPRDRLASQLWGERDNHLARDNLKHSLMRLRRHLSAADSDIFHTNRHSISINQNTIATDVAMFERLVREGTIPSLSNAATIYKGDLLDDVTIDEPFFDDWLSVERQRLRQLFEQALTSLTKQTLMAGDRAASTDAATRLLQLDPLNEPAHRTLMQIYVEQGQTAHALKLYETLCRQLSHELGIEPEAETVTLHDFIRQRQQLPSVQTATPLTLAPSSEGKLAIAISQFINTGNDQELQPFCDVLTKDIVIELSRFSTLSVAASTSEQRSRGDTLNVTPSGRDRSESYVTIGSVRKIGKRLRITVQLTNAVAGNNLWADSFYHDALNPTAEMDDLVGIIATTLGYRLEAVGRDHSLRMDTEALSVHDLVMRSEALLLRFTKKENDEARQLAEKAVELDPRNALAHAQLGWTHCMDYVGGWSRKRSLSLEMAFAAARRAVLLDELDCRSRWLLGNVHIYRREFAEAEGQLQAAITLNPNDVEARGIYGFYLIAVGQPEAAIEQFDFAKSRNPHEFNWMTLMRGIALFTAHRYDEAIATLQLAHNHTNEVRCWLAASYAAAERLEQAHTTLAEFLAIAEREMPNFPGRNLNDWKQHLCCTIEYRDQANFDHLLKYLRAAGLS